MPDRNRLLGAANVVLLILVRPESDLCAWYLRFLFRNKELLLESEGKD
jgi:hypothetical protein